jgi:hypothetical protein
MAVFLVWLILFGLLLKRDFFIDTIDPQETSALARAETEEYQGIYFQRKKIGFVASTFEPDDDRTVTMRQRARMDLNVAGSTHPIDLRLTARLSPEGRLQDFTFTFQSPFYRMQADGRVSGRRVNFRLATGSTTIEDSLELSAPPLLSTSRRAYLLTEGLKPGEKFRIPWFDPVSLTGKDSVIEYRGRERVLIHGRVQNLHHFIEVASGTRINSWLDDRGDVLKEESPAGFVFLKEAKFKALAGSEEGPELLSAVSAKVIGSMPRLDTLKTMHYRLHFPDDGGFQLNSGRQSYADGRLRVDLESLPVSGLKDPPPCTTATADLAATASVQVNHPRIRKLAAELVADRTDDLARVRAIAGYVYSHLEKRPVLGLPDALTTLDTGMGDCNEHAVLFAALARAAGIPCRIAAGVMYYREAFYYHAWNEVCIGGEWLSLDTTTNQLPADLSHIKFIEGETREQMRIGALLGQLAIEPLPAPAPAELQEPRPALRPAAPGSDNQNQETTTP